MKYDIANSQSPKMPDPERGTKCLKYLLSQPSKGMLEPFFSIIFPFLAAIRAK